VVTFGHSAIHLNDRISGFDPSLHLFCFVGATAARNTSSRRKYGIVFKMKSVTCCLPSKKSYRYASSARTIPSKFIKKDFSADKGKNIDSSEGHSSYQTLRSNERKKCCRTRCRDSEHTLHTPPNTSRLPRAFEGKEGM
jgi:hypothetical protein